MLSLKCKETEGMFAKTKHCRLFKAHKYLPEDSALFKRAVRVALSLLAKRAKDLQTRSEDGMRALRTSLGHGL
jgi:hypothetical protein